MRSQTTLAVSALALITLAGTATAQRIASSNQRVYTDSKRHVAPS
jgi:hypothetical protein